VERCRGVLGLGVLVLVVGVEVQRCSNVEDTIWRGAEAVRC
jgi:hypothetical protein